MRTSKPKSAKQIKRAAEKSVIRLGKLFKPDELFFQFTFLARCRTEYGIQNEKAGVIFADALDNGQILYAKDVGKYPGIPVYKLNIPPAEIQIQEFEKKDWKKFFYPVLFMLYL